MLLLLAFPVHITPWLMLLNIIIVIIVVDAVFSSLLNMLFNLKKKNKTTRKNEFKGEKKGCNVGDLMVSFFFRMITDENHLDDNRNVLRKFLFLKILL